MTLDVHVVSHTHWDREWYHPLERFRQRLVALIDELLDDPPSPSESFLLDGQAIVLEDYLAVRPERREELRQLLGERRLEAGPWLVLADELIPSGEALVRNLLAGRRALERLGVGSPPVLYCPDSFGHPAALPAVAAGFGLPLVILWRGFGGARWPRGDTHRWIAPNGDAVLLYHLPRDGYEFGSHLPADANGARERWARMRNELAPRSTAGVVVVPNGADHHARQRDFGVALAALERAGGNEDGIHRSSLSAFASALIGRAESQELPVVRGELRDSYGYTWTLQGTFATRAHEKRMNARAERVLTRDAEPWAAMAALLGRSRRPLVHAAWRTLLEAHPHDTLCGCSIDDVARTMELRIRSAENQAVGIREDAIHDVIGHDAAAARTAREEWMPIVVIRNAAARPRGGVALVDLEEFIADVPVGPGSASRDRTDAVVAGRAPRVASLGAPQVLSQRITNARTESPRHYPDNDLVSATRVAVWVDQIPAYGIRSYAVGDAGKERRSYRDRVKATSRGLSNASLSISVDDGAVSLSSAASANGGRRIASLISIIDEADVGDTYTPAPRPRECRVHLRRVRRGHRGPLVGSLVLDYRITAPNARGADVDLELTLSLHAGESFLRVDVKGDNRRENHRVRLRFRADMSAPDVWADAAFGPVRRERLDVPPADAEAEKPPRTAPLHRYVSSFGADRGFTVLSDGLAEYEAFDDGGFAVTLVRSVGELSRNDLPERPGHAGWPTPTPGAQCLGAFEASFGILLHGPRLGATVDAIEAAADDFLLPLSGASLRSALSIYETVHGPELVGPGLACSAIKESEHGAALILRCVNLRDEPTSGEWRLPFDVAAAELARLDETSIEEVERRGRVVPITASPRGIVTVRVR